MMIPHPVKPATKTEEMRPRCLGKSAEMWNCAKWKVMLPRPRMIAAGMKAFTPLPLSGLPLDEKPKRSRPSMLRKTPARSFEGGPARHGRASRDGPGQGQGQGPFPPRMAVNLGPR